MKLEIRIADGVEIPTDARLVVIQGFYPPRSDAPDQPEDAPWGHPPTETLPITADQRTYHYEGSTCCSPVETNYSFAYIDLNGNETYDEGEPYGADPNNPVEVDDDYSAVITVENPP